MTQYRYSNTCIKAHFKQTKSKPTNNQVYVATENIYQVLLLQLLKNCPWDRNLAQSTTNNEKKNADPSGQPIQLTTNIPITKLVLRTSYILGVSYVPSQKAKIRH